MREGRSSKWTNNGIMRSFVEKSFRSTVGNSNFVEASKMFLISFNLNSVERGSA